MTLLSAVPTSLEIEDSPISTLNDLSQQVIQLDESILEARKLWNEKTKPLITKRLEEIIRETGLKAYCNVDTSILNQETVQFCFKNKPSGMGYNPKDLYNQQENRTGPIMLTGGALHFAETYVGKIVVWFEFPVLEYHEGRTTRHDTIDTVDQNKISITFIDFCIEKFLEDILKWHDEPERQPERNIIGYKNNPTV